MADVSLLYLCCSKSIMVFGTAVAVLGWKFRNFNRNATGRAQRYPPGHTRVPHGFSLPLSPYPHSKPATSPCVIPALFTGLSLAIGDLSPGCPPYLHSLSTGL